MKQAALILCILVIFTSCQKADAEINDISEISTVEPIAEGEPQPTTGVINDSRVRLRAAPNLESETLEFLNTGEMLIILDRSVEQQQIETMMNYWYKVQVETHPEGWVYGEFVDFINYEIVWRDASIENVVREMLDKPDGIIMKSDLDGLESLELVGRHFMQIDEILLFENLTQLTLTTTNIEDLSPLYVLPRLTELYLHDNHRLMVGSLSGFTKLTKLMVSENLISPSLLSDLTDLTYLRLEGIGFKDISGLSALTNLTELYLDDNNINDLSPLLNLRNLSIASFNNNEINDISALSNLSTLTELYLGSNEIIDISALSDLTNLTVLNLNNNGINDVGVLANLTNLTELYLGSNAISDIDALANLTNLMELYLDSNEISDIRALSDLRHLTQIDVGDNASTVSNLLFEAFDDYEIQWTEPKIENEVRIILRKPYSIIMKSDLDGITELRLIGKDISKIDDIAHFTNLTVLDLRANPIEYISALSGLKSLTELSLGHYDLHFAFIKDISPLSTLTNLTSLNLRYIKLRDLSPLSSLINLTKLNLNENYFLSDISPLSTLSNLTELKLYDNDIKDIGPLASLSNLTTLWLDSNEISDISALAELQHLTELRLYNNAITDWSPVSHVLGKDESIFWKESVIENEVRRMLGKFNGSIMPNDLDSITKLDLSNSVISETDDLKHFKNLTSLKVDFGSTYEDVDLLPLSGFTNLTTLWLMGKKIKDLSPLSGLTNLTELYIDNFYSSIGEGGAGDLQDITSLSSLTNLTRLTLTSTDVSDLNPLSSLINLTYLDLKYNPTLDDISVLSRLPNLSYIDLSRNYLADWSPIAHVEHVIGKPE